MKNWYFDSRITRAKEFRAVLRAINGEIVFVLESYNRKAGLRNGIDAIKEAAFAMKNFKRHTSTAGKPYFTLQSEGNHKVLGHSEEFETIQAMEDSIFAMSMAAPYATTKERFSWYNFYFETVYGEKAE